MKENIWDRDPKLHGKGKKAKSYQESKYDGIK
jgi:hypothetical protein